MALNQLIAQGVGTLQPPASNPNYMNALASMRNAELQRQSKLEELAFNRQKWEQEQAAARQALENRNAAMILGPQLTQRPDLLPYVAALDKEAANAFLTGRQYDLKAEEQAEDRYQFREGAAGRNALNRSTVATAAGKELENEIAGENRAIANVLQFNNKAQAFNELNRLTIEGKITEPKARALADTMGAFPDMATVREHHARMSLTPQQLLEQNFTTVGAGGETHLVGTNKYGGGVKTQQTFKTTMTPDQVADNVRANEEEIRKNREEDWKRSQDIINREREDKKFKLEEARTNAQVAKDESTRKSEELKAKKLEAEAAEIEQVQKMTQEPDFDMKNPASRQKLMGTDAGRAVVKSYTETVKADVDRETSDITLQLKKQEQVDNQLGIFMKQLGFAKSKQGLDALFRSVINDPVLGNQFGSDEDEQNLLLEIQRLDTPEKVQEFIRQTKGKFESEKKVNASDANRVKEWKAAKLEHLTNGAPDPGELIDYLNAPEDAAKDPEKWRLYTLAKQEAAATGQQFPRSFDEWNLKNVRAGATNISQNVDLGKDQILNDDGTVTILPGSKTRAEVGKEAAQDLASLQAIESKSNDLSKNIDKLLVDQKGLNLSAGGYAALLTQHLPQALDFQARLESVKSQITNMGLDLMRQGGSIGQITEREWPRLQASIATIKPTMSVKETVKVLNEVKAKLEDIVRNARSAYDVRWKSMPDFYRGGKQEVQKLSGKPVAVPAGKPWEKFKK